MHESLPAPAPDPDGRWVASGGHDGTALVRLVCLGGIGAGTAAFAPWRTCLPPWVDVAALRLPGRESRVREAPITDAGELVDRLVPVVTALATVPYLLVGHCFGAIVLFETARRVTLQAPALWPEGLVVLHQPPPTMAVTVPDPGTNDVWARFRQLVDLDRRVLDNPPLRRMVEPMLRADFALADSYVHTPAPPLPIDVSVWLGAADGLTTREEALAWAAHTSGPFAFHTHEGGHAVPSGDDFTYALVALAAGVVVRRWGFQPT